MAITHLLVKESRQLNGIGFGVEHFADYRRLEPWLHTHDTVELNYVVAGAGTHLLGDCSFATGPGSLGIVHYTQPHDILTGHLTMEVINLYLDLQRFQLPALGEELSSALYAILPMHPSLRHRCNHFVHLQFEPAGEPERLLRAMLAEQSSQRSGYCDALRSLLSLFLIHCARASQRQSPSTSHAEIAESEARVERLRRELDADPAASRTLEELAQKIQWSPPHLCRMFRRHTGMSLMRYIQRQRLNAAMVRLRTSSDPVISIALACGFNDPSFFTRSFRQLVGTTPSAYRRRFLAMLPPGRRMPSPGDAEEQGMLRVF